MGDMRVITEPTIYLVGRQSIDEAELARFLADEDAESWTTDTEVGAQKLVEVAGRCCYASWLKPRPGGNSAYLGHILEVGHGSVIEHAVFNLVITGVSRSLTHELVRHRAGWSYSQRSQRFCDESKGSFVVPPLYKEAVEFFRSWEQQEEFSDRYESLRKDFEARGEESEVLFDIARIWTEEVEAIQRSYTKLSDLTARLLEIRGVEDKTLRRKRAREAARSVLPNATATEIFVTANARALRGMLEQRGAPEADAEIRRLSVSLCRLMKSEAPALFADFEVESSDDAGEYLTCRYRKV
jgi:thymidylate synthase (FAD)